jgi:hypothetical protein
VVAAMGAATRMLHTEGAADHADAGVSSSDQPSADGPRAPLGRPPRWGNTGDRGGASPS